MDELRAEQIKMRSSDVKDPHPGLPPNARSTADLGEGAKAVRHWKCPRGHVLGFVERRRLDGRHVTVLLELRQAIDLTTERMIEPRISGVLEGGKTIICSACEARGERVTRYFSPSEVMLAILLERVGGRGDG